MKIKANYQSKYYFLNLRENEQEADFYFKDGDSFISYNLDFLAWDSKIFGKNVGKISSFQGEIGNNFNKLKFIEQLKDNIYNSNFELLYFRHDLEYLGFIEAFEEVGFKIEDIMNIYFGKADNFNNICYVDACIIEYNEKYKTKISRIAKNSFHYSRFYNDYKISNEIADSIYDKLFLSILNSPQKFIRLLKLNSEIAGFVLGERDDLNPEIGYLWLIGLAEKYRGKGHGDNLLRCFLKEFSKEVEVIEIGTQVNNLAANKIYRKNNLNQLSSIYTMHWHRK